MLDMSAADASVAELGVGNTSGFGAATTPRTNGRVMQPQQVAAKPHALTHKLGEVPSRVASVVEIAAPVLTGPGVSAGDRDVLLEVVHASGVDVACVGVDKRFIRWRAGEPKWVFGREVQSELISCMVPDERFRPCIASTAVELSWQAGAVFAKKLSSNNILVDGVSIPALRHVAVADGAHVGVCGLDAEKPFITFRVDLGGNGPAPTRALGNLALPVMKEEMSVASSASPSYVLSCLFARGLRENGCEMHQVKTVDIPAGSPFVVGRQKQPGFFESLLKDKVYLNYISRSHFELHPLAEGRFQISNWSVNPIVIEDVQLEKGMCRIVCPPVSIDFVSGEPGVLTAVVYLRLRLEQVHAAQVLRNPVIEID